jgi:predicted nucleotidyltransferase
MQQLILDKTGRIKALCEKHYVEKLHVFGSAVREDFNDESDIDFLVEFKPISDVVASVDNMDALREALGDLLEREVDLIQYSLLSNKYLKHFINQEKVLIHAEA